MTGCLHLNLFFPYGCYVCYHIHSGAEREFTFDIADSLNNKIVNRQKLYASNYKSPQQQPNREVVSRQILSFASHNYIIY